ncbi:MAG: IS256 family transposase [Candidatus Brocadiia bacterium]
MQDDNVVDLEKRIEEDSRSELDNILREGARQMLQAAVEAEVSAYVEKHKHVVDPDTGRRLVVRNGYAPARNIQSGLGDIEVQKPRARDQREGKEFTSSILPPYMRKAPSIEALLPVLYLKGISTNDFPDALQAILGEGAAGLSPSTICRLKRVWQEEYEEWNSRDLSDKKYVYWWVDGIYFNVRLTDDRPCLLVIVGTLEDGTKELVGIWDGERESKLSWLELLRDLKGRGVQEGPKLCVGDGALGFWRAKEEQFPKARKQRCWVHKTANVLDKMPKKMQPSAKSKIHEMYMAETKEDALEAFDEFMERYEAKYPAACECLKKDKEVLFTFYDFPARHWVHIRTTNPIESTFATVRHRSRQTKGCGSRKATLTMVFKLGREAEKHWRRINGYKLIPKVISGVKFKDGIELKEAA